MKPLTSLQKREAIDRYCELVVDRMDVYDLEQYVIEDLKERYGNMTDNELNEYNIEIAKLNLETDEVNMLMGMLNSITKKLNK